MILMNVNNVVEFILVLSLSKGFQISPLLFISSSNIFFSMYIIGINIELLSNNIYFN